MQGASLWVLLQGWSDQDFASLQSLSKLPARWILTAEDLQKSERQEDVLSLFGSQLSLLSEEVESTRYPLAVLVSSLQEEVPRSLLVVENFSEVWIKSLLAHMSSEPVHQGDLLCFCEIAENSPSRWRALLGVERDYRQDLFPSRLYRTAWLQSLQESDLASSQQILLSALSQGADLREQPLSGVVVPSLKLSSWERLLFETKLTIATVRKNGVSPLRTSVALALGVFIACTPLYGLQTFLIVALCWLLRLNFAVAFLGSQISLPPFYAGVIFVELFIGLKLLGLPFAWPESGWLEFAQDHGKAWFLGALIFGSLLSALLGLLCFLFLRAQQDRSTMQR